MNQLCMVIDTINKNMTLKKYLQHAYQSHLLYNSELHCIDGKMN